MTTEEILQLLSILIMSAWLIRIGLKNIPDPFDPFWEARKSGGPIMGIFLLLVIVPFFFENQLLIKMFAVLSYIFPLILITLGVVGLFSIGGRKRIWHFYKPSLQNGSESMHLSVYLLLYGIILFLFIYSLDWGNGILLPFL